MVSWLKQIYAFVKDVAEDPRIPDRDKKILLALLVWLVSPVDLIPDWIPIFGMIDDLVVLAIILDYLFDVLDSDVLLSHYPFGMKSFARLRRFSRMISWLTPDIIKDKIWKYRPNVYS